jgi:hypothetical protein
VALLYTNKEVAGAVTGRLDVVDVKLIRGINKPVFVELMSSFAELFGVDVPIPTF